MTYQSDEPWTILPITTNRAPTIRFDLEPDPRDKTSRVNPRQCDKPSRVNPMRHTELPRDMANPCDTPAPEASNHERAFPILDSATNPTHPKRQAVPLSVVTYRRDDSMVNTGERSPGETHE